MSGGRGQLRAEPLVAMDLRGGAADGFRPGRERGPSSSPAIPRRRRGRSPRRRAATEATEPDGWARVVGVRRPPSPGWKPGAGTTRNPPLPGLETRGWNGTKSAFADYADASRGEPTGWRPKRERCVSEISRRRVRGKATMVAPSPRRRTSCRCSPRFPTWGPGGLQPQEGVRAIHPRRGLSRPLRHSALPRFGTWHLALRTSPLSCRCRRRPERGGEGLRASPRRRARRS